MPSVATTAASKAHISLRIHPELLAFIDAQAAASFKTRNQLLQDLVLAAYQAHQQQHAA